MPQLGEVATIKGTLPPIEGWGTTFGMHPIPDAWGFERWTRTFEGRPYDLRGLTIKASLAKEMSTKAPMGVNVVKDKIGGKEAFLIYVRRPLPFRPPQRGETQ